MLQIAVPALTLVVGVILGAWYNAYLRRPSLKLAGSGSGGGPGPGYYRNHVNVANEPGLFGVRLNDTMIFGKGIHGRIEKGLTIDRNPANECRASLHDKQTGRHIAPLWWRSLAPNDQWWHRSVTIQSGEQFELWLFARLHDEAAKYFPFAPANENTNDLAPLVSDEQPRFEDTHDFLVRITYSYGRQSLTFDGTMRKGFDGRLVWESKSSGGAF